MRRALAPPVSEVAAIRRRTFARMLACGARSTVYTVRYSAAETYVRVRALERPESLGAWCARESVSEAVSGGFFVRPAGPALGELWVRGRRLESEPFDGVEGPSRSCVAIEPGGPVQIARRAELPAVPRGDLIQAGPLLVEGGRPLDLDGDPEGFSSGAGQFDSDITRGRYPRLALGVGDGALIVACCDGRRSGRDAGLTLPELARLMADLGATAAINLDGGGSAALLTGGRVVNRPYRSQDVPLLRPRPIATLFTFEPAALQAA